jgi:purine-nucleoside phosphorylase
MDNKSEEDIPDQDTSSLEFIISPDDYFAHYKQKVDEAVSFLKPKISGEEWFGVVLGSGLSELAGVMVIKEKIPYENIPNFPKCTVKGHDGNFIIGKISGLPVIGLQGRKHFYEVAHKPAEIGILDVVFPINVLAGLGVPNYFATNAVGGLNLDYAKGDMMVVKTHISTFMPNPIGLLNKCGLETINGSIPEYFPAMNDVYDPALIKLLEESCRQVGAKVHSGTLVSLKGPSLESCGDSIMLRKIGADAVGMSSIQECMAAKYRGMCVVAMSIITNTIDIDGNNPASHDEVSAVLENRATKEKIARTLSKFFELYYQEYM